MKKTCVICDEEKEYACGFMEYVNRKKALPFSAVVCTSRENLKNYAKKNPIDILLVSEGTMEEDISDIPAIQTIVLGEGIGSDSARGYKQVYKYQACGDILREVMNEYSEQQNEEEKMSLIRTKNKRVIGVYSPAGENLRDVFALASARVLSEENNVLFIDMTPFSGFENIYDLPHDKGLSDLLYFSGKGPNAAAVRLSSIVSEEKGVDMVPGVSSPEDLYYTEPARWTFLVQEILDSAEYDTLVLDLGLPMFELFDICTEIYIPIHDGSASDLKWDGFSKAFAASRYREAISRTQKIDPPVSENDITGEFWYSMTYGRFGEWVRKLLNGGTGHAAF